MNTPIPLAAIARLFQPVRLGLLFLVLLAVPAQAQCPPGQEWVPPTTETVPETWIVVPESTIWVPEQVITFPAHEIWVPEQTIVIPASEVWIEEQTITIPAEWVWNEELQDYELIPERTETIGGYWETIPERTETIPGHSETVPERTETIAGYPETIPEHTVYVPAHTRDVPGYCQPVPETWTEFTEISDEPTSDWTPHTDEKATGEEFLQSRSVHRTHRSGERNSLGEERNVTTENGPMEVVQLATGTGIWSGFDEVTGVEETAPWAPHSDTIATGTEFNQTRTINRTRRLGERHTSGSERNVTTATEEGVQESRNVVGTGIWTAFDDTISVDGTGEWTPSTDSKPAPEPVNQSRTATRRSRVGERHTDGRERNVATLTDSGFIERRTVPGTGTGGGGGGGGGGGSSRTVVSPPPDSGTGSDWYDVNGDGYLDEIIGANDPRVGLLITVEESGWEDDFAGHWSLQPTVIGERVFYNWSFHSVPPSQTSNPWATIEVVFAPEPGYQYVVWKDDEYGYNNEVSRWPASAINGLRRWGTGDLVNGSSTISVPDQRSFLWALLKFRWYVIKLGTPGTPSNLKIQGDNNSIFASWTNPAGSSFSSAVVAWSAQNDLSAALADPSRHATTTDGYYSIEGLTNGVSYNIWVFARSAAGVYSPGALLGSVTPSVPIGYSYQPFPDMANAAIEEVQAIERGVILKERSVVQQTSTLGQTLRAVLRGLNALVVATTPVIYTAEVHAAAKHIAVRIAREAYLKGEITAEQYLEIVDTIAGMNLPPVGMAQGEAEHNVKLATDAANAGVAEKRAANQNNERTSGPIHRFGGSPNNANPDNRRPSRARPLQDFGLPPTSPGSVIVGPYFPPTVSGASAFGNIHSITWLSGHYWTLPAGVILPLGIGIVADGSDVQPGSDRAPTHHTIYPKVPMSLDLFNDLMRTLPWHYGGFKP